MDTQALVDPAFPESAGEAAEAGRPASRSRLVALLRGSKYRGITKPYEFDRTNGGFGGTDSFLYRLEDGGFRFRGPAPDGE